VGSGRGDEVEEGGEERQWRWEGLLSALNVVQVVSARLLLLCRKRERRRVRRERGVEEGEEVRPQS
jgi:hypothetical protein